MESEHPDPGNGPELSAIILCFGAGPVAAQVAEPLWRSLRETGLSFEIVLVANYWPDRPDETPAVVTRFAQDHEHVVTVIRSKEGAMGWDMRTGLEAATGRHLIVIDGDAQNPVDDVLHMYHAMKSTGFAVMKGRRVTRLDGPYREALSFGYNLLFRILFPMRGIWDINGKPKGLTRRAYEQMTLRSRDWFIDAEIVLAARRLGLAVGEIPVTFAESKRPSFVRPSAAIEFLVNLLLYRLRGRSRA